MAHTHGDPHTTVVERDGYNAGLFMGVALVLLLAVVGLALLFTQPWDDDSGGTSPGIEDAVPGEGGGDDVVPGNDGGGTDGGGTNDGGSGGGDVQPPTGQ